MNLIKNTGLHRVAWIGVTALLLTVAGGAIAAASSRQTQQTRAVHHKARGHRSAPRNIVAATARRATPADALNPAFAAQSTRSFADTGVDFAQARKVAANTWLAPGPGIVCLHTGWADKGPTTCASKADVDGGGAGISGQFAGSDPSTTALVPDGVSEVQVRLADGTTKTITVVGNTWTESDPSPAVQVSFDGPQGPVISRLAGALL